MVVNVATFGSSANGSLVFNHNESSHDTWEAAILQAMMNGMALMEEGYEYEELADHPACDTGFRYNKGGELRIIGVWQE